MTIKRTPGARHRRPLERCRRIVGRRRPGGEQCGVSRAGGLPRHL